MAKAKTNTDTPPIPFEKAIEDLESIVKDMESARLPLDVLIEKYEHGNRLLKICQERIEQAELRIERIASGKDGIQLDPFEAGQGEAESATGEAAASTEEPVAKQNDDESPESGGEDGPDPDASSDEIKLF